MKPTMSDLIAEYVSLGGTPPKSGRFRTKAEGEGKITALRNRLLNTGLDGEEARAWESIGFPVAIEEAPFRVKTEGWSAVVGSAPDYTPPAFGGADAELTATWAAMGFQWAPREPTSEEAKAARRTYKESPAYAREFNQTYGSGGWGDCKGLGDEECPCPRHDPETDPTTGPSEAESAAAAEKVRRAIADRQTDEAARAAVLRIAQAGLARFRDAQRIPSAGLARLWADLQRRPRLRDHPGLDKKTRAILRRDIRVSKRERRRRAKLRAAIGSTQKKSVRVIVHGSGAVTAELR